MSCPRVRRAIKGSTLDAPLRHTLSVLTDHIKSFTDPTTAWVDHNQPATLEVYQSVERLAADTGYSKPTVMSHLLKLRGFIPVPGTPKNTWPRDETRAVLEFVDKSRQHKAARYRLNLGRLEALQRSRNFTAEPTDTLPADKVQELRHLTAEAGQGFKNLPLSSQAPLPESLKALPQSKQNKLARAHETAGAPAPAYTPPPDCLDLPPSFISWCQNTVPALDVEKERNAFLRHCQQEEIWNRSWLDAFKSWLRKAKALESQGKPTASHPHPGRGATASPATPTRTTCSWDSCGETPCPHHQACTYHAGCEACRAEPAPEGNPAPAVSADTRAAPLADSPPEVEAAEVAPPAEVQALLQGFLQGHTMPATSPPPAPLGSLPRQKSALTRWRERWREDDQPTYMAAIAERQARAARDQPAMAAD